MIDSDSSICEKNKEIKVMLFFFLFACVFPIAIYIFETTAKLKYGEFADIGHRDGYDIACTLAESMVSFYVSTVVPAMIAFLIQFNELRKSASAIMENKAFNHLTIGSSVFWTFAILRWILYGNSILTWLLFFLCIVYTIFIVHWFVKIRNKVVSWTPSG